MEENQMVPPPKKDRVKKEVQEWLIALLIALVVALVLTQVVFVNAQIPSESMEPTIQTGDRVAGYRLAYLFEDPARGDIIIFRFPDDESQLYVKRLVGLPGETVEIKGGKVFINGEECPEANAHIKSEPRGDYGPWTVPADSYFMMGDNRDQSYDSRFWNNSFVRRGALVGKAVFRLFPNTGVLV